MELEEATSETSAYTYCDGCNHVPKCGIVYHRQGEVITRLYARKDFNYPASTLCSKGYAQLQEQYHPERLRYPLKRTTPKGENPKWKRISWEEAIRETADQLNAVKNEYGAQRVCFYCGDPKEMRPPLQRLAFAFGSPNFGTESSNCFRSVHLASLLTFGTFVMGNPPGKDTKNCFIWGVNPAYSAPFAMKGLLKSKQAGVNFVHIDPRATPTVKTLGGKHLLIRPGTDGALALGMMQTIISEEIYDKEHVRKWVHGFGQLKEYASQFAPERVSNITGAPADQIRAAARSFADGPTALMVSSAPIVHHTNGLQNMRAVFSLVALTGNFDRPGGVVVPPPALLPPDFLGEPGFCLRERLLRDLKSKRADLKRYPVWADFIPEVQMNRLPEYVEAGTIRAMLLFGGNTKIWPQPHLYQKALAMMDFSVAVDYFYRPWTHNYVDVLLPAATSFERLGPPACFGRSVYQRQPVKPLGQAREDWQIIADLGVALGLSEEFCNGNLEAFINEHLKSAGLTVEQLRNAAGSMISKPLTELPRFRKFAEGLLRKDGKPGFETPTGKIELYSTVLEKQGGDPLPVYSEPVESPVSKPDLAKKYPLVLMTGARVPFYTHSKFREIPWLSEFQPEPVVNLNDEDAAARGIGEGDSVFIENDYGKIKVKAHLTKTVRRGVVDMFHGWADQDVNSLVPRHFDPISGFPPFKAGLCQVSKATS
jgi:anaerobic selenocysteine-containing dehydrogenase